jgi:hypothetical protein
MLMNPKLCNLPSFILDDKASLENPAKTILCIAPIRAHASIATTAIGDAGM